MSRSLIVLCFAFLTSAPALADHAISPRAPGSRTVRSLTVGGYHGCAVRADMTVWCWGYNGSGQIGAGPGPTAVKVPGLDGVVSVSAGDEHTCALKADGTVWCWGRADKGALGYGIAGATDLEKSTPVKVTGLSGARAISSGDQFTCAILDTGRVRCWGQNLFHQLGLPGSNGPSWEPAAEIPAANGTIALAAGRDFACALSSQGQVLCWGRNDKNQIGTALVTADPTWVGDGAGTLSGYSMLAAGTDHACAGHVNGTIKCWGGNAFGQLGNKAQSTSSLPVSVTQTLGKVTLLAAGNGVTCTREADGTGHCWGNNDANQLGFGAPVPVALSAVQTRGADEMWNPIQLVDVATGRTQGTTCLLGGRGWVSCYGSNTLNALGKAGGGFSMVTQPFDQAWTGASHGAGSLHQCSLTGGGAVNCWGDNDFGQLGDGTFTPSSAPVAASKSGVASNRHAVMVAAGGEHTCLLSDLGDVSCWGRSDSGQLGAAAAVGLAAGGSPTHVIAEGVANAVSVAAGRAHTCALLATGKVMCWGDNSRGQLGTSAVAMSAVPLLVTPGGKDFVALSAHGDNSCAVTSKGQAWCWGDNTANKLVLGGAPAWVSYATIVASSATRVSAGAAHVCALQATGGVVCNGAGTAIGDAAELAALGAVAVGTGEAHACALLSSGLVKCWGEGDRGQRGNNSLAASTWPTFVVRPDRVWGSLPISDIAAISVGYENGAAVGLYLWGWGANDAGQVGVGNVGTDQLHARSPGSP